MIRWYILKHSILLGYNIQLITSSKYAKMILELRCQGIWQFCGQLFCQRFLGVLHQGSSTHSDILWCYIYWIHMDRWANGRSIDGQCLCICTIILPFTTVLLIHQCCYAVSAAALYWWHHHPLKKNRWIFSWFWQWHFVVTINNSCFQASWWYFCAFWSDSPIYDVRC